jgi:hypothetical protein
MLAPVRAKRWYLAVLSLGLLLATSCTVHVGCVAYKIFEPGQGKTVVIDRSACVSTPPPVISETHSVILLPVIAVLAVAAVLFAMKRRRATTSSV